MSLLTAQRLKAATLARSFRRRPLIIAARARDGSTPPETVYLKRRRSRRLGSHHGDIGGGLMAVASCGRIGARREEGTRGRRGEAKGHERDRREPQAEARIRASAWALGGYLSSQTSRNRSEAAWIQRCQLYFLGPLTQGWYATGSTGKGIQMRLALVTRLI